MLKIIGPENGEIQWIGTPQMRGPESQWQMELVIANEGGNLCRTFVPWGLLPKLYLGRRLRNGRLERQLSFDGKPLRIRREEFPEDVQISVVEAAALYPECKLRPLKGGKERCIVIDCELRRYIVPSTEVARAYFGHSRWLANTLLQPHRLDTWVQATLEGDILEMQISADVPAPMREPPLVDLLALIAKKPSWRNEFLDVSYTRQRQGDDIHGIYDPLVCRPPDLPGTAWLMSVMDVGHSSFVFRIKAIYTYRPFPFSEVRVEVKGSSIMLPGGTGDAPPDDPKEGAEPEDIGSDASIDPNAAARGGKRTRSMGGVETDIKFVSTPRYVRVAQVKRKRPGGSRRSPDSPISQPPTSEARNVSLGTEGRWTPGVETAEVSGTGGQQTPTESFDLLYRAFEALQQRRLSLKVRFERGKILAGDRSGVSTEWALILLAELGCHGAVLELEPTSAQDSQHLTIAFPLESGDADSARAIARELLTAHFRYGKGWRRNDLKSGGVYSIAHARDGITVTWAAKIYDHLFPDERIIAVSQRRR